MLVRNYELDAGDMKAAKRPGARCSCLGAGNTYEHVDLSSYSLSYLSGS